MFRSQKPVFSLWIEAIVIIVIRFGVQLANLSCIWLSGWIYRQPLKEINKQLKVPLAEKKSKVALKPNPAVHQNKIESAKSTDINFKSEIQQKPKPTTQYDIYKPARSNTNKQKSNSKKALPSAPKQSQRVVAQKSYDKKIMEQGRTEKDIDNLRKKISILLRSRNEGISLFDIGKAIGEKESRLRDIANPKTRIMADKTVKLENILFKIEKLYQREHANTI